MSLRVLTEELIQPIINSIKSKPFSHAEKKIIMM